MDIAPDIVIGVLGTTVAALSGVAAKLYRDLREDRRRCVAHRIALEREASERAERLERLGESFRQSLDSLAAAIMSRRASREERRD